MTIMSRTIVIAALLALGACAGGGIVASREYNNPVYHPGYFSYAATGRDFHVIVVGNPTGASDDAFTRVVIAAMMARNTAQRTNFTTVPGPDAHLDHVAVLVFSGRAVHEDTMCRELGSTPAAYAGGPVHLSAAYCLSGRVLNGIDVRSGGLASPADPMLGDMVSAALRGIFPSIDFRRGNNDSEFDFF